MSCNDDACINRGHPWCDAAEDDDPYYRRCRYCDSTDCDGSGYNCEDGHYQEYNLRGWPSDAHS